MMIKLTYNQANDLARNLLAALYDGRKLLDMGIYLSEVWFDEHTHDVKLVYTPR